MSARDKPLHLEMVKFCRYHLGKDCFAPFTGVDYPTWNAFVYLLQCHAHGGGMMAIGALRQTLAAAQHTEAVLRVFVQAIPGVLDWSAVAKLWPAIASDTFVADKPGVHAIELQAIERVEVTRKDGDRLRVEESFRAFGWKPQIVAAGGSR